LGEVDDREVAGARSSSLRTVVASGDKEMLSRIQRAFSENECIELVGVAGDGIEAAQLSVISQPDVVVVDDRLDGDGLRVCAVLSQVAPKSRVVLLVQGLNEQTLMNAARAGAREVLSYSFEPRQFLDAIGRLSEADKTLSGGEYEWATNPKSFPRLLMVSSAKGGTGVTSIAVNLATALSTSTTGRIVLVDGHPRCRDAASMLSVSPRYGLADLAESFKEPDWGYQDQVLLQQTTGTGYGLDVVVSASTDPGVPPLAASWLARAALMLKRNYRFIVVDVPAFLLADLEQALPTYWRLLMVGNLKDATLLQNTRRFLAGLAPVQPRAEKVGLILNRDLKPSEFAPKDVQEVLQIPLVATIPKDQNLLRAHNLGKAVVVDNPGSPSAKAIRQLADHLLATADVAATGGQFLAAA